MLNAELRLLLDSLRTEKLVYVPNRGNAGDSFITHSTYQFLSNLSLDYKIGRMDGNYPDDIVILGGGGNLVHPYPNMYNFLKRNVGQWKKLIILPHTIRSYSDVLQNFDDRCHVFCREKPSVSFVRNAAPRACVYLADDMALTCDLTQTQSQFRADYLKHSFDSRLLIRNSKRLARVIYHYIRRRGDNSRLFAFRTDVESTSIDIPYNNFDVSQLFAADDSTPISSLHATYWMMKFIRQFDIVETNRLHVGIMSAMLGKDVRLFDNSYGKNHDIYMNSLSRFPNVRWQTT